MTKITLQYKNPISYSKQTSSLISRGARTPNQIWAMHPDGFITRDGRPCWLDDCINPIVDNIEVFLKSERLCRCDVVNNNTCTLCKGFGVWRDKIGRTLSFKHFQRRQAPISDDCTSASGADTCVKSHLPPLMVLLRLNEFEFRCYEIPDDFRKIAFSIKLYSSFCDEVLRSSNLATSVDGNVTAIAGLIGNELLNEYLQQHTFKSFSPDKNAEFFDLFRTSNSLFYFFDDHAQFHMLYPKLIDAIMDKARH